MFRFFKKKVEETPQAIKDRANRAYTVLQWEGFQEVLRDLEDECWEAHFNTAPDDAIGRDLLYSEINAVRRVESRLEEFVQLGKNTEFLQQYKGE